MAKRIDPVTGSPVDWSMDPRNPDYDPGVAPAYDKKTTATFGDVLPIVYGTAKVKGSLVWLKDTASPSHIGWKYIGNETSGRFVPVDPHTDMVVGVNGFLTATTTTKFVLKDGGGATIEPKPYLWQRVYFWSVANPTLNGLSRLISAVDPLQDTVTLDSALPVAPTAGDFITVGPSIGCRVADAIYAVCEAPVNSVVRYFRGSVMPETTSAHLVAHDDSTRETVIAATAGTWPAMQADADAIGMTMSGTVQFRAKYLLLDKDGKAPDIDFEVQQGSTTDADPASVVIDLFARAGISAANVDVDTGTDGNIASSFRRYCSQMNFTVSRAITSQTEWATYLGELLDQCNAVPVRSGSTIRIVPLGSEVVGTYTPPSTALALTNDDFQAGAGEDPVTVTRRPDREVFNSYAVTYQDRSADYAPVKVEYIDEANATTNTVRRAQQVEGTWLVTAAHAQALASIKTQRSLSIRNVFSFRVLPGKGALLQPMDLLSLTESKLGLSGEVVRIKSIDRTPDGLLSIEAYEWPAYAASPIILATQAYNGFATGAAVTPVGTPANNALPLLATTNLGNVLDDSVVTALIAPEAVTGTEVAPEAIDGTHLAADSLATSDFAVSTASDATKGTPTAGVKMLALADVSGIPSITTQTFYYGNLVTYGGKVWRAIANNFTFTSSGNVLPDASPNAYWAPYAPLQVGPGGMQLGTVLVDEVQASTLKAIGREGDPAASTGRVWYRGNNSSATKGGAPDITCLSVIRRRWNTAYGLARFDLVLTPSAANDNLDGMRYAKVVIYRQAVAGTGTQTFDPIEVCTVYHPFPDRLYAVPGTDGDAGNKVISTMSVVESNINANYPLLIVTLYNAFGPSDAYYFYTPTSPADGQTLTAASAAPAGWGGSPPSAPSGGGNGGGGTCMAPETAILIDEHGTSCPLFAMKPGDRVWTKPEEGGDFGYHEVTVVKHATNLRQRVTLRDGRAFVCSINHRILVRGIWRRADSLQPGEEMDGKPSGTIASAVYLGEGPVVQLSIPTAKTYFSADGLFQHNLMKEDPT